MHYTYLRPVYHPIRPLIAPHGATSVSDVLLVLLVQLSCMGGRLTRLWWLSFSIRYLSNYSTHMDVTYLKRKIIISVLILLIIHNINWYHINTRMTIYIWAVSAYLIFVTCTTFGISFLDVLTQFYCFVAKWVVLYCLSRLFAPCTNGQVTLSLDLNLHLYR